MSECMVRDSGRELLPRLSSPRLPPPLLLCFVSVSVENRLMPLSVLTEGHLLASLREPDDICMVIGCIGGPISGCPSGIDFECRIDDCAAIGVEKENETVKFYAEWAK